MTSDRRLAPHGKAFCVYHHVIDGKVIYVGKGRLGRPYDKKSRNPRWRAAVAAAGGTYEVRVVALFDTDAEACALEREQIDQMRPPANMLQPLGGHSGDPVVSFRLNFPGQTLLQREAAKCGQAPNMRDLVTVRDE